MSVKYDFINEETKLACETGRFAVVGVSPFNSYYTAETIKDIIEEVSSKFLGYKIYLPTQISECNFRAQGYSSLESRKKTLKQDRYLLNRVKTAISKQKNNWDSSLLVTTDLLVTNQLYLHYRQSYFSLYQSDSTFRSIIHDEVAKALSGCSEVMSDLGKLKLASTYILNELPIMFRSIELFECPSAVFIYHKIPDFVKRLNSYFLRSDLGDGCLFAGLSTS